MPFALRRITSAIERDGPDDPERSLELTRQHEVIAAPRKGSIDWRSFSAADYDAADLDRAAAAWRTRAIQEFHSLALFTQLSSNLHLLGAPLDWCGAFARMIGDEVRHTDLCLRMADHLAPSGSATTAPMIAEETLHLSSDQPLATHVRDVVIAAFCIGETLSARMFKRVLRAATVPLAREVVSAILVDETFHGELGWELGALLMRAIDPAERDALAGRLPHLFTHYARLCDATRGPSWARAEPEADPAPNFATLTSAGYARAFFDGMAADVVPGLVAIGLPEAQRAFDQLLSSEARVSAAAP